jgi:adenylate cyclase
MAEPRVNRKLAAILSADVVGYSKLMADDEAATVDTLKQYRAAVGRVIERHEGRIVNAPGDNILAEFASAVNAVQAAVEIQKSVEGRNVELPDDRRMRLRIGLNLGDVIEEDDGTIYGDGVNIAARMEALAEEGGICISSTIHDAVEGKLDFGFDFLGERPVKNIAKPVRVYRVRGEAASAQKRAQSLASRRWGAFGAVATVVVVVGALIVWFATRAPAPGETVVASTSETRDPVLALPTGPSIAVLPFVNLSGDPEQEYFSDGISETIITDLSRLRGLKVIARNSSFAYKGESVDLRKVSRELGVRHVLEGSVQKAGTQLRITAQLIDGASGDHVWASRWDRPLQDIFALQDEITQKIVTELDVTLVEGDQARIWRRSTSSPEAYDLLLRAGEFKPPTKADYDRSKAYLEKAVQIDPEFAMAWVRLGWTQVVAGYSGWADSPAAAWDRAIAYANRALAIDAELGEAYTLLTEVMMFKHEQAQAMEYARRALDLNPSGADTQAIVAIHTCWTGDGTGLIHAQRAMTLNPHPPGWYYNALGSCYRIVKRYEEAIAAERKCADRAPDYLFCYTHLALASLEMGDEEAANEYAKEIFRINPNFRSAIVLQGYVDPSVKEYHRQLFRKLGIQ